MSARERGLVLVTGATGCLGSNLTRELVRRGERVAILRRPTDATDALGPAAASVEHRFGDVTDADSVRRAMDGVKYVYHVAGVAAPVNAFRREMLAVNFEGARNVAEAALAAGVARLVHTSSVSAVGFPRDGVCADEGFEYNGDEFGLSYAETKRRGEEAVLRAAGRGLDAVVVNPSAVMAPGGDIKVGWAALIGVVKSGRLPFYPGGGVAMTTRADMVDGHLKAMERGRRGERYILNSVNVTYRDLFETVAQAVGARAPRRRIPNGLLAAAGYCNGLRARLTGDPTCGSMLFKETVPLLTRRLYYSQAKAVRELGLTQTPLADAVREVHQWFISRTARP